MFGRDRAGSEDFIGNMFGSPYFDTSALVFSCIKQEILKTMLDMASVVLALISTYISGLELSLVGWSLQKQESKQLKSEVELLDLQWLWLE